MAIEHDHRVIAAIEDEDVVILVDSDRRDFVEGPSVGKFGPIAVHAIAICALPKNYLSVDRLLAFWHVCPPSSSFWLEVWAGRGSRTICFFDPIDYFW